MRQAKILLPVFCLTLLAAVNTHADDWKPLYNGKDMTGWQAIGNDLKNWKADGEVFYSTGGSGWLATADDYKNFELEIEFKLVPDGNSGLFLRAPLEGNPAFAGMELQMLDNDGPQYKGKLKDYQYNGGLYGIKPSGADVHKPAGEWQKYHVVLDGRKLKATLNGTVIHDINLDDYQQFKGTNPGINRESGRIGLQIHDGPVQYRNARIKVLP